MGRPLALQVGQEGEPFGHRGMGVERFAERGVRDVADHRGLDCGHRFAGLRPEDCEPEDLVAVGGESVRSSRPDPPVGLRMDWIRSHTSDSHHDSPYPRGDRQRL